MTLLYKFEGKEKKRGKKIREEVILSSARVFQGKKKKGKGIKGGEAMAFAEKRGENPLPVQQKEGEGLGGGKSFSI